MLWFTFGSVVAYIAGGAPAVFLLHYVGKLFVAISDVYYGASMTIISLILVGCLLTWVIWRYSKYFTPLLKGMVFGLVIRVSITIYRQVQGLGPDPYTNGWLYSIEGQVHEGLAWSIHHGLIAIQHSGVIS